MEYCDYLEVENCAENDENDNNDDCESQSISINTTTINNNALDDIAMRVKFNTRVKARVKAREERARSEKARKALQKIRCCNIYIYISVYECKIFID